MTERKPFIRGTSLVLSALLSAALLSCGTAPDEAVLLQEVFDADRAFNVAVAEHDTAAFLDRVDPEAVFFGSTMLRGRDAVAGAWADIVSGEIGLSWAPDEGGVSGNLGYTIGAATFRIPDEEGNVEVSTSRYVTIWRKGDDGIWRAAVDIGTPRRASEPGEGGGL